MTPLVQTVCCSIVLYRTVRKPQQGDDIFIQKLMDVKTGLRCCVLGTLFKAMPLQPSILKEISEEQGLNPLPAQARLTSDEDCLILEDESQRIALTGVIPVSKSVTGAVIALVGQELSSGRFEVEDYTYCGIPPQDIISLDSCLQQGEDRFVLLVSGLGVGRSSRDPLPLQLLIDTVSGQLGGPFVQEMCSKIVRVIVAGNALSEETKVDKKERGSKLLTRKVDAISCEAVKELDELLTQLASCVPVDVMPGANDPANYLLPQQPFSSCMFPETAQYSTMHLATNPFHSVIGGVSFLGTSGQSISDIYQFSNTENRLDILEHTLVCNHLAPTAPDTLGCVPYFKEDPFVIKNCPNVFYAGNQPLFQSRFVIGDEGQQTLLILIPDFCKTSTCVLVNLRTLECQPMSFGSELTGIEEECLQVKIDGAETMDKS
ncbi:DNA polymerase delta subunit 2-like isoform X2 [Corticium candelabrum]|uniref:DNA polymerase delta subunit 2-like isoform X2 n=1 Tax=Corticium candelabrum TaxID=121492 RepID=UPI002E36FC9D|nr:DNA polymerase delta subunit 2-like isoform X2 [Corticium candelabrum]